MVRLATPLLLALSLVGATQAKSPIDVVADLASIPTKLIRVGLVNVLGFNESSVERILKREEADLEAHEHAVDLTDDNYETILATGQTNPFATPLPADDVWVITVFGPDPISKVFLEGMNDVATYNSSSAGGTLPASMHFARVSYAKETILPTRLWLWRVPVVILATDNFKTIRFLRPGMIRPNVQDLSALLAEPDVWKNAPVWEASYAPGGTLEPYLRNLAHYWSKFHRASSKIPQFALLAFSGFVGNFVLGFFHKGEKAKAEADAAQVGGEKKRSTAATSVQPFQPKTTATAEKGEGTTKRK